MRSPLSSYQRTRTYPVGMVVPGRLERNVISFHEVNEGLRALSPPAGREIPNWLAWSHIPGRPSLSGTAGRGAGRHREASFPGSPRGHPLSRPAAPCKWPGPSGPTAGPSPPARHRPAHWSPLPRLPVPLVRIYNVIEYVIAVFPSCLELLSEFLRSCPPYLPVHAV